MMDRKLTKFQMLIVFVAVTVFISQLAINGYYEWSAPAQNLADKKKLDLSGFYQSPMFLDRANADSLAISQYKNSIAELRQRNQKELLATGRLKHKESIDSLTALIVRVNNGRLSWAQSRVDSISQRYAAAENFWLSKVGGMGLMFVFEFLAIMFGFLAPRRQKIYPVFGKPYRVEFIAAIAASFLAQVASCLITQKGLYLLLGDSTMSWLYSVAFILLVPLYYWIGGMDIEEREMLSAMATVKTVEKTESVSRTQTLTERTQRVPVAAVAPKKPKDWRDACCMVVAGQLKWSDRQVVREYPESTWYGVRKEFKALRSKNPISSPQDGDGKY